MRVASALLAALALLAGCDGEKSSGESAEPSGPRVVAFEAGEPQPMLDGISERRDLVLSQSQRHPDCHEFFEPDGEVVEAFPLEDGRELATKLAGCEPEAYVEIEDGRRFVGYSIPGPGATRATDLRVVAFDAEGKRMWSFVVDRSAQGANFVANYRGSFIAPLLPRMVCAGTLWEGGTQVKCVDAKTADTEWDGRLPFWSGIEPQGRNNSLYVADLSAMTRRYPYSGVEMRHKKLADIGGRAGLYATDGEALYFAPARAEEPRLLRYDFDEMRATWKMSLPDNPAAAFGRVVEPAGLLLLKIDTTCYAIDTGTGRVRWAYEVGEDRPSVAHRDGTLYVLHRRPDDPNTLVALDPETGERKWAAATPSGTLEVLARAGVLMLKSVRAVQVVEDVVPAEDPSEPSHEDAE